MIFLCRATLVFFVLSLLTACGLSSPRINKVGPLPENFGCRVAVLPFIDHGRYPRGAQLFNTVFSSELVASAGFKLIQEGDILDLYRQLMIYPTREPFQKQLQMIASRLGVQFFIGGDVIRMTEQKTGGSVKTELTVALRIYDGKSGKVLWTTYHKRRGKDYKTVLHFGRINTITGLARKVSKDIINFWLEQGMAQCAK